MFADANCSYRCQLASLNRKINTHLESLEFISLTPVHSFMYVTLSDTSLTFCLFPCVLTLEGHDIGLVK